MQFLKCRPLMVQTKKCFTQRDNKCSFKSKIFEGFSEAKLIETIPNIVMGNYFSNKAMMPRYLSLYCCEFFHIEKSTFDLLFKNAGYEIFKTVLSKIDDVTNATQCHMLFLSWKSLIRKIKTCVIMGCTKTFVIYCKIFLCKFKNLNKFLKSVWFDI